MHPCSVCADSFQGGSAPALEAYPGDPGQPDRAHAGMLPQELRQPVRCQPGEHHTEAMWPPPTMLRQAGC